MKPVERSEILDYVTYEEQRPEIRARTLQAKEKRRVELGDHFTFLFENRETVRYQIQEMVRTERIVKEADIQHEIDTYNELLGGDGELGCTLLIGIDDPAERSRKLVEWRGLCEHIYAVRPDQTKVPATYDPRQVGEERLSSVQYLEFAVGDEAPIAVGIDMPGFQLEAALDEQTRAALQEDLDA